jgi:hypothetical protein
MTNDQLAAKAAAALSITPSRCSVRECDWEDNPLKGKLLLWVEGHSFPICEVVTGMSTSAEGPLELKRLPGHPVMEEEGLLHHDQADAWAKPHIAKAHQAQVAAHVASIRFEMKEISREEERAAHEAHSQATATFSKADHDELKAHSLRPRGHVVGSISVPA